MGFAIGVVWLCWTRLPLFLVFSGFLIATSLPTSAEVRFGSNVRIGGHDFSHQRYDRKHRAVIHIYDRRRAERGADGDRMAMAVR